MKPLKILFAVHAFFPDHFYGTETYTLELAQSLQRLGHETVILTATPWGEKGFGTILSTYEYANIPVYCIDLNLMPYLRFKDTYYRPALLPLLRDIVTKVNPDIVHVTHLMRHSAVLLEVLRDANIPAVTTLTDFYGICLNSRLQRYNGLLCSGPNDNSTNCLTCYLKSPERPSGHPMAALAGSVSKALPFLAAIPGMRNLSLSVRVRDVVGRVGTLKRCYGIYRFLIAPSDYLNNAYASNGFYPDKLKMIPFGIDLGLVRLHQRAKVKHGPSVRFGYIGQISRHKGIDLLIKSYLRLRGENRSLVIYGPIEEHTSYVDELLQLSRGVSHIEFRNKFPREELPRRLSELDVLVIPSRWHENSPMVLLYALATKTPVIVTRVNGMTELVKDDFNGYTFEKDNIIDLTSVMQKIVDEPERIERLSQNAIYSKNSDDHARDVLNLYGASLGIRCQ